MRKLEYICLGLTAVLMAGCTNGFAKFYHSDIDAANRPPNIEFYSGEPKAFNGTIIEADNKNMLENSYVRIGYSSYNGTRGSVDDAKVVARDIGAEFLIYYSKFSHTISGSMPFTVQNPNQTVTSYGTGTVYGSGGGYAAYNSTTTTVVPGGTTTQDIPYSVDRFDFQASYWAKKTKHMIGIYAKDLSDDLKRQLERNKGVVVNIVVKGTPAYEANILPGDVIIKIDGEEVADFKDLAAKSKIRTGKTVDIEIIRNGIVKPVQVKFN
jgi:membrane-associated protease RseP (regulator of RpoE activity)